MTEFRVGDVVRSAHVDELLKIEELGVREGWAWTCALNGSGRGFLFLRADNLTLVRRPLRVGDRLRGPYTGPNVDLEVTSETLQKLARKPDWLKGCTHEDGTPIELPAHEEPAAYVVRVGRGRGEGPYLQNLPSMWRGPSFHESQTQAMIFNDKRDAERAMRVIAEHTSSLFRVVRLKKRAR